MRKLYYILICISVLFIYGCEDEFANTPGNATPGLEPRYLALSATSLDFETAYAADKVLDVASEKTAWGIQHNADWITLSPNSGNSDTKVNVSVSENFDADKQRLSIMQFEAKTPDWSFNQQVSVVQAAATPVIELSEYEFSISGEATTRTVNVSSNCNYEVRCENNWISCYPNGNSIIIDISANKESKDRTGTVVVSYVGENTSANVSSVITIWQRPANLSTDHESEVSVNKGAHEFTFEITSETDWTTYVKTSTDNSWIEVTPDRGAKGTTAVTVKVAQNAGLSDRSGYVYFNIGTTTKFSFVVNQEGLSLDVDKNSLSFESQGNTKKINVTGNVSWKVVDVPEWLTVTPMEMQAPSHNNVFTAELSVTADENLKTEARSAVFQVLYEGLSLYKKISVSQAGVSTEVDENDLIFEASAGSKTFTIETTGEWSVSASDSWITVSPTSGKGNAVITVSVAENTKYEKERMGDLTINIAGVTTGKLVKQKGLYFDIESKDFGNFTSKPDTALISFQTNESWVAYIQDSSQDWVKFSKTEGTGSAEIELIVDDNASVNSREAEAIIKPKYGTATKIKVKQAARYLRIDTERILFYAKGGTSSEVTVDTDGEFKVEKSASDSWYVIRTKENKFTVIASESDLIEPRYGNVIVSLTDLKEGQMQIALEVVQLNDGGSFIKDGYKDDENYDNGGAGGGADINIDGYDPDKGFDVDGDGIVSVKLIGYKSETNYDPTSDNSLQFIVSGYDGDKDYDNEGSSSSGENSNLNKDDYKDDENYDKDISGGEGDGGVNKDDYKDDENYDKDTSGGDGSGMNKDDYKDDENYDAESSEQSTQSKTKKQKQIKKLAKKGIKTIKKQIIIK